MNNFSPLGIGAGQLPKLIETNIIYICQQGMLQGLPYCAEFGGGEWYTWNVIEIKEKEE